MLDNFNGLPYSGKIKLWILVLGIALFISQLGNIWGCTKGCATTCFADNRARITIGLNVDDEILLDAISSKKSCSTKDVFGYTAYFSTNIDGADVIISSNKLDNDKYKEIGYAYSPIVLVSSSNNAKNSAILNVSTQDINGNAYETYTCSFDDIMNVINNEKMFFTENNVLVVPKRNTIDGNYVWQFIFNTKKDLTHGTMTDEELIAYTNDFYAKCEQSNSILTQFKDVKENNENSEYCDYLWLVPEHYIINASNTFVGEVNEFLVPIYMTKNYVESFYLYIKSDSIFLDYYEEYMQEILMKQLCIRYNDDTFYKYNNGYKHMKSSINYECMYIE